MFEVAVLTDSRLAASGFCYYNTDEPVVWLSESGVEWTRVIEGPLGMTIEGIEPDSIHGGLLIAANDAGRPAVWHGDPSDEMAIAYLPEGSGQATVEHVASSEDGYLAVGYEIGDNSASNALAWWADRDMTDWQLIDVPSASEFEEVVGDGSTGMFTVTGGAGGGATAWDFDFDGGWSAPHEGIAYLIDAQNAFGYAAVWRRVNGSWRERLVRAGKFDLSSAARLSDGWIVGGRNEGKEPHPFEALVARDGGAWHELAPFESEESQVLDMTHFADRVLGVGDAVYLGSTKTGDY